MTKTRYLTGTIHYLTFEKANNLAKIGDEIIPESDGTYSIFCLSPEPRQYGQVPYIPNPKNINNPIRSNENDENRNSDN